MTILDLLTSTENAFARNRDADLDANERLLTLVRILAADIERAQDCMEQLRYRIGQLEAKESGGEP